MLYAGLDLSRKRLDVHVLRDDGTTALVTAVSPDTSALRTLVRRVAAEGEPVRAAIESMNGARFVHDSLEFAGWDVLIADAGACPRARAPGSEDGQDRRSRARGAHPSRPRAGDHRCRRPRYAQSGSGPGSDCTWSAIGRR